MGCRPICAWAKGHHPEGLRAAPHAPSEPDRAWERHMGRKQRSIAARSRLLGTKERRKYRMEVAALGEQEERFMTSTGRLMLESEQWVHLPPDVMTVRFRLLARAGSTFHGLLQVPHEGFPFHFFTVLSDPTIAQDLSESLNTPCELDDWSGSFLACWATLNPWQCCGSSHMWHRTSQSGQVEVPPITCERRSRKHKPVLCIFWLECRSSSSDTNSRCMDLFVSVISPLSSRFCGTRGVIVVVTVHTV